MKLVKNYSTQIDEQTALEFAWIQSALKELGFTGKLSKRAILARAMSLYTAELEYLVHDHNFAGSRMPASVKDEFAEIKKTTSPLRQPAVRLDIFEKFMIQDNWIRTLKELRDYKPPRPLTMPRFLMTDEEKEKQDKDREFAKRRRRKAAEQKG